MCVYVHSQKKKPKKRAISWKEITLNDVTGFCFDTLFVCRITWSLGWRAYKFNFLVISLYSNGFLRRKWWKNVNASMNFHFRIYFTDLFIIIQQNSGFVYTNTHDRFFWFPVVSFVLTFWKYTNSNVFNVI